MGSLRCIRIHESPQVKGAHRALIVAIFSIHLLVENVEHRSGECNQRIIGSYASSIYMVSISMLSGSVRMFLQFRFRLSSRE
jgi:hypothetical protein